MLIIQIAMGIVLGVILVVILLTLISEERFLVSFGKFLLLILGLIAVGAMLLLIVYLFQHGDKDLRLAAGIIPVMIGVGIYCYRKINH